MRWIIGIEDDLVTIVGHNFSGRNLILHGGGPYLNAGATSETQGRPAGEMTHASASGMHVATATFVATLAQILVLDLAFSLDSVITAVSMADEIIVMVLAVIISIGVILLPAGSIGDFTNRHPTVRMLALGLLILILILIGSSLVIEGCGRHIERGTSTRRWPSL